MIADKMMPSFYMIEVEGLATKGVVPGDHGIDRISIGSTDYENDMMAMAGMNAAMKNILKNIDMEDVQQEVSFNPEFFPTLKPIELTEEQKAEEEETLETVEALRYQMQASGKFVVPISSVFDPLGDFVEARFTVETSDMKVEGKVAANPQHYMIEKYRDMEGSGMMAPVNSGKSTITIH